MKFAATKKYLLKKPEAIEDYPFGPEVAVFKVLGKMFATLAYESTLVGGKKKKEARMNLKCDPNHALMLRQIFPAVIPGYHMNKKHWNTLKLDGTIPTNEIRAMINHSYALVVQGLKKAERDSLRVRFGAEHFAV